MALATMLEKASHLSPRSLIRKDMSNTTFKHYVAPFKDVSGDMWALLIAYPDTEETKSYPKVKEVRLGVPAVTLTTESEDALSPVVKGRLAFSLLEERADQRYRHLMQAPDGSVSVVLFYLEGKSSITDEELMKIPSLYDPMSNEWTKGYWRGVLDPESYKEPANQDTGYLVSFEANDFGRLSRVNLMEGGLDMDFLTKPRMSVLDFVASLVSLGLGEWDRSVHKSSRTYGLLYVARYNVQFIASHFSKKDGDDLFVDIAPFVGSRDKPITALEALERILGSLSMRVEQGDGILAITDVSTVAGNEMLADYHINGWDEFLDYSPHDMVVKGNDAEFSALPAVGNITIVTKTHLNAVARAFDVPALITASDWHLVPRATVVSMNLPAWRYRTDHNVAGKWSQAIVQTEEITTGEDRNLFALVWNTKSIHGFAPGIANQTYHDKTLFLVGDMLNSIRTASPHYNLSLRAVDESGQVSQFQTVAGLLDSSKFIYQLSHSFAGEALMKELELSSYIAMLKWYRDQLNSSTDVPANPLRVATPWRMVVPDVPNDGRYGLRLDVPLLLSMSQDIYQELSEKSQETVVFRAPTVGRGYAYSQYKADRERAKNCIQEFKKFTDQFEEVRLYFRLTARGDKGVKHLYDLDVQRDSSGYVHRFRQLGWGDSVPHPDYTPHLTYGGGDNKLSWGTSWNHPRFSEEDIIGEGLYIPLPPEGYNTLELEVFSNVSFYKRNGETLEKFREWKLWSVPSAIVCQAPSLWLSDAIGRRGEELSKDRRERFVFTSSTGEGAEAELHLSAGDGIVSVSPSIIHTKDGKPLSERGAVDKKSGYTQNTLAGFRAECFGAIYGSLPERGYELTGTFAYHHRTTLRRYAGMEWLAVSREIDIQQGTERGTYHQVRKPAVISSDSLSPEVLDGDRFSGERYDTSSPRYWDNPNRPTPPPRRR